MSYNKNVVEDALFQIKNLEETLQENAKGILQSTMSEEIKQLVKESLKEQDEDEVDNPTPDANAPEDMDDDEMAMDDDEMDMDDEDMDMDDDEMAMDDEDMDMDDDEMAMDDDETIDMTGASDAEVLRVFKAMGDEDGIVVKKEGGNIHFTDGDNEYMINLGESEMEDMDIDAEDYFEVDEDMDLEMDDEETIYEIEMDDESYDGLSEDSDMMGDADLEIDDEETIYEIEMGDDDDEDDFEMAENWGGNKHDFKRRDGHKMGDVDGHYKDFEMMEDMYMDDEEDIEMMEDMYMDDEEEIEMMEDMDSDNEDDIESVMEAIKKSIKPKGVGIGRGPKFSYDKKPNMGGGFSEKKKEAFGKGTKAMGTGKAKFEYKEGNREQGNTTVKKMETKEASRTYGNGSKNGSRGLRKGRSNNRNYEYNPFKISESHSNEQVQLLREKNDEYKKALDVFRTKLNEVAVFNSNLAYATRLFTEHSTTKQEKINILRRFDNVESLKESKNLYRTIKTELNSGNSSSEQKINESIERTVNRSVETGSSVNLIESKTYENPQFLRMKDLMGKIK